MSECFVMVLVILKKKSSIFQNFLLLQKANSEMSDVKKKLKIVFSCNKKTSTLSLVIQSQHFTENVFPSQHHDFSCQGSGSYHGADREADFSPNYYYHY